MTQRGRVEEAVVALRHRLPFVPEVGVVLGSGLGDFANLLKDAVIVPYTDIPNWPASTAIGHAGKLAAARIGGRRVIVLSGRAHLYEGYTPQQVTFGVRVLKILGAHSLLLTNAAGGINLEYGQGSLVAIRDHINLQGVNPLTGHNDEFFGPRFPDMSEAYSKPYRALAQAAAVELGSGLPEGIYAAVPGPNYETPAEIRYLRTIGADLVGMSTVPESIVANHMGMQVLAISCVTNMAAGVMDQKIHHDEVLETGRKVRELFSKLLLSVIPRMNRA